MMSNPYNGIAGGIRTEVFTSVYPDSVAYREGDRILNIDTPTFGNNGGKYGTVASVTKKNISIVYDDGCAGECNADEAYKFYKIIHENTIMENVVRFAKNLVLSADEKLLRKVYFKNQYGDYTNDAREIVMEKLMKENEVYLLEVAKAIETETKKD